ncbi:hypothetical protein QLQ12_13070 [Actinoplanes sp. NEAU-A12]|uniref:Uncharacterized protein n=1 Tax=Actinoplanes sandaracinus TaxID=3045177 RepID=A0ABT6WIJ1_9ACTN|nr:hypothetical protein [Actinoplanes sandaracinus]MDI6099528.1 hypothetical protein [Actinoplanes sandaracinus]
MHDVAKVNTTQPADWAPTAEQRRQAGRNEAYPATGRVPVREDPRALSRPA